MKKEKKIFFKSYSDILSARRKSVYKDPIAGICPHRGDGVCIGGDCTHYGDREILGTIFNGGYYFGDPTCKLWGARK